MSWLRELGWEPQHIILLAGLILIGAWTLISMFEKK